MRIDFTTYSNNILFSSMNGINTLKDNSAKLKDCRRTLKNKYSTYSPNGQIKNYTTGLLFDQKV